MTTSMGRMKEMRRRGGSSSSSSSSSTSSSSHHTTTRMIFMFFLMILGIVGTVDAASSPYSLEISQDTQWISHQSMNQQIVILSGTTLTIRGPSPTEPISIALSKNPATAEGTQNEDGIGGFLVMPGGTLIVENAILTHGLKQYPPDEHGPHAMTAVSFQDPSGGIVQFKHVKCEYMSICIQRGGVELYVQDSIFYKNGIALAGKGRLENIERTLFAENQLGLSDSDWSVQDCIFFRNHQASNAISNIRYLRTIFVGNNIGVTQPSHNSRDHDTPFLSDVIFFRNHKAVAPNPSATRSDGTSASSMERVSFILNEIGITANIPIPILHEVNFIDNIAYSIEYNGVGVSEPGPDIFWNVPTILEVRTQIHDMFVEENGSKSGLVVIRDIASKAYLHDVLLHILSHNPLPTLMNIQPYFEGWEARAPIPVNIAAFDFAFLDDWANEDPLPLPTKKQTTAVQATALPTPSPVPPPTPSPVPPPTPSPVPPPTKDDSSQQALDQPKDLIDSTKDTTSAITEPVPPEPVPLPEPVPAPEPPEPIATPTLPPTVQPIPPPTAPPTAPPTLPPNHGMSPTDGHRESDNPLPTPVSSNTEQKSSTVAYLKPKGPLRVSKVPAGGEKESESHSGNEDPTEGSNSTKKGKEDGSLHALQPHTEEALPSSTTSPQPPIPKLIHSYDEEGTIIVLSLILNIGLLWCISVICFNYCFCGRRRNKRYDRIKQTDEETDDDEEIEEDNHNINDTSMTEDISLYKDSPDNDSDNDDNGDTTESSLLFHDDGDEARNDIKKEKPEEMMESFMMEPRVPTGLKLRIV